MSEWQDIDSAPYGEVVLVRNSQMEDPVKATRGYVVNGAVHENQYFFTSVFTECGPLPFPSGRLIIPDEWMPPPGSKDDE